MAGQKLDLEKLRQAMATRSRPSDTGTLKTQEYGASYKSPYSKINAITRRPSAPSVLVNTPPPPPSKPQAVSAYAQSEMNKGRKSILVRSKKYSAQQDSDSTGNKRKSSAGVEQQTKMLRKQSGISGYFTSTDKTPKVTQQKTFLSPLMNAPSLLAQQRAALTAAAPLPPPPPLIPPRPAKTENLPRFSLAVQNQEDDGDGSRERKVHQAGGRVSFFQHHPSVSMLAGGGRQKKISLIMDPTKRQHSIRDGSIDLDIDAIATAQVYAARAAQRDKEDDDDSNESLNFFREQQLEKLRAQKDRQDSLIQIRPRRSDKEESSTEWKSHRVEFAMFFAAFVLFSIFVTVLTSLFVFQFNYGIAPPSPDLIHQLSSSDPQLAEHLRFRYLLNTHMLIMIVPCIQLLQFSTLLYRIFPTVSRTKMKWIHGSCNMLAVVARVIGLYYTVRYHNNHLYSMHSYIGVFSMMFHAISVTTGVTFILPCCSWETRVNFINIHLKFGNLIMVSDSATAITGCIQMSSKFFDSAQFPQFYPDRYEKLSAKSIVLNLLSIGVLCTARTTIYILERYEFRRRRRPGATKIIDLDLEAINRVAEMRQYRALAIEAKEHKSQTDMDDIQIGSRKSFNLATKQKFWHLVASKGDKSIPALINDAQKQKSNFTDTDILLALE